MLTCMVLASEHLGYSSVVVPVRTKNHWPRSWPPQRVPKFLLVDRWWRSKVSFHSLFVLRSVWRSLDKWPTPCTAGCHKSYPQWCYFLCLYVYTVQKIVIDFKIWLFHRNIVLRLSRPTIVSCRKSHFSILVVTLREVTISMSYEIGSTICLILIVW